MSRRLGLLACALGMLLVLVPAGTAAAHHARPAQFYVSMAPPPSR